MQTTHWQAYAYGGPNALQATGCGPPPKKKSAFSSVFGESGGCPVNPSGGDNYNSRKKSLVGGSEGCPVNPSGGAPAARPRLASPRLVSALARPRPSPPPCSSHTHTLTLAHLTCNLEKYRRWALQQGALFHPQLATSITSYNFQPLTSNQNLYLYSNHFIKHVYFHKLTPQP